MSKEMLINTVEEQECRIAIVNDGLLEELYVERVSSASHVGNIYKGRVMNVEPSIQAAFVDFGLSKNGFLHISDVSPQFFPKSYRAGATETVGRKRAHRERPPIQECLRRGQEVVVQLTKEGIGTKGPTLTTYLSIPGRLLVMMPGMSRLGVSRKIEDDEARVKAKQILAELNPPADMGFIVRTAGLERPKRDFQRDLNYLLRLWKSVKTRISSSKAPAEIYQESDLVTRTIRDVYNTDIERIVCDSKAVAIKVKDFLDVAMPRGKHNVELYVGKEGLFHDYGLEHEIERIYARRVELPSGGSLVIDQAEALVAIDVNSGRFREHADAETNALKLNMEAAKEIARQLRLRDLGGVVIIDFVDMRHEKNRRAVEKVLREEIRKDRAKTKVLKISAFGIVEMTRQRVRPSLKHSIYRTCWHCAGAGLVKSEESQALAVMRSLQRAVHVEDLAEIQVTVTPAVEHYLANYCRKQIASLEASSGKRIIFSADPMLPGDEVKIICRNTRGNEVAWEQTFAVAPARTAVQTVKADDLEKQAPEAAQAVAEEPPKAAAQAPAAQPQAPAAQPQEAPAAAQPKPARRRRSRGRKRKPAEAQQPERPPGEQAQTRAVVQGEQPPAPPQEPTELAEALDEVPPELTAEVEQSPQQPSAVQTQVPGKKARRRGKRGGRKHKKKTATPLGTDNQGNHEPIVDDYGRTPKPAEAADVLLDE